MLGARHGVRNEAGVAGFNIDRSFLIYQTVLLCRPYLRMQPTVRTAYPTPPAKDTCAPSHARFFHFALLGYCPEHGCKPMRFADAALFPKPDLCPYLCLLRNRCNSPVSLHPRWCIARSTGVTVRHGPCKLHHVGYRWCQCKDFICCSFLGRACC